MNQNALKERQERVKKQEGILGKYKMGAVVKILPEQNSYSGDFGHIVGFSTTIDNRVCLIIKTDQEELIRYNLDAVELI